MRRWRLEEAKNRFSELVRGALAHEPQLVTRSGRDAVVVLSAADYERLAAPRSVAAFMRASPLADAMAEGELDLTRSREGARDVAL
jgi:prevent-host-death family protein